MAASEDIGRDTQFGTYRGAGLPWIDFDAFRAFPHLTGRHWSHHSIVLKYYRHQAELIGLSNVEFSNDKTAFVSKFFHDGVIIYNTSPASASRPNVSLRGNEW